MSEPYQQCVSNHAVRFLFPLPPLITMNALFTSFPDRPMPLPDLSDLRRTSLTRFNQVVTVLMWAVAITYTAGRLTGKAWYIASPYLGQFLRSLADVTDPSHAPLFEPITTADIDAMNRDQLLQVIQPDRPVRPMPEPETLDRAGDYTYNYLKKLKKAELKVIAGVSTDMITREQLIARIQHGRASDNG